MASKPLASGLDLLTFTPEIIDPMIQIGLDDATTMVTTTQPGDSFKKLDDWVDDVNGVRQKYASLNDYLYDKERAETF